MAPCWNLSRSVSQRLSDFPAVRNSVKGICGTVIRLIESLYRPFESLMCAARFQSWLLGGARVRAVRDECLLSCRSECLIPLQFCKAERKSMYFSGGFLDTV